MELQTICRLAEAKGLMGTALGTGQRNCSGGNIKCIIVPFDCFHLGQTLKQGVGFPSLCECDRCETDLHRRSEMHLGTQGFCKQLPAKAHAQHRLACFHRLTNGLRLFDQPRIFVFLVTFIIPPITNSIS